MFSKNCKPFPVISVGLSVFSIRPQGLSQHRAPNHLRPFGTKIEFIDVDCRILSPLKERINNLYF